MFLFPTQLSALDRPPASRATSRNSDRGFNRAFRREFLIMRGRKPTPTHLKLVKGNPGRRPLNDCEPAPRKMMPKPPADLSGDARDEWARVAPELYRVGLLTSLDRSALAAYCQLYARWREAERGIAEGGLLSTTTRNNLIQNCWWASPTRRRQTWFGMRLSSG